jgi:hypothetical protein
MNLKARKYVESQKKDIQAQLDARLASLREKGLDEKEIQRNAVLRALKAKLRKSNARLRSIAAQEKLNSDLAQAKLDKLAAKTAPAEEVKEEAAPAKKEKKAKKEKQEKPEKQEKQPKAEKKEKKEKKPEADKPAAAKGE